MNSSLSDTWSNGSGRLVIDLDAIATNYRTLTTKLGGVSCGACVKANAYGLGMERVAQVLAREGCNDFFFSFMEGAIRLRYMLPEVRIHVFSGLAAGKPADFVQYNMIPVLNSLGDIKGWSEYCRATDTSPPASIHIDSGMSRLGLPEVEVKTVLDDPSILKGLNLELVMSHLACADESDHPKNKQQLDYFRTFQSKFSVKAASLANSSGIFLGPQYHFDLARPGAAIYGINPTPDTPSPMRQVIRLQGKIMQVQPVDTPQSVGYGANYKINGPSRIATVGAGYADGYLRSLSGNATVYINDIPIQVVGRVSMDMISIDVTNVPEHLCQTGMSVDLIGPHNDVDALAKSAGTIGYEILTSLGRRYERTYLSETD